MLRRLLLVLILALPVGAFAQEATIGIVVMHGKGGGPQFLVTGLARALEGKGYLVANIEMPWSGRRQYDVAVSDAEREVDATLADLRARGAKKVFIAGHSQGGVFALYLAGRLAVDGIIPIAPGGDVAEPFFRSQISAPLGRARALVAEGKGAEPAQLEDFEGARGYFPVNTRPAIYVGWFDLEGAMNAERSSRAVRPGTPVLWIAPTRDLPALRKMHPYYFRMLPPNPGNRFAEPNADHRGAPPASIDEIERWTKEIAAK